MNLGSVVIVQSSEEVYSTLCTLYSNINYYQKDRVAVALKKRPSIYFFNLGYILLAWKCRLRGGRKGELVDLEALFLAASFLPFMHTLCRRCSLHFMAPFSL